MGRPGKTLCILGTEELGTPAFLAGSPLTLTGFLCWKEGWLMPELPLGCMPKFMVTLLEETMLMETEESEGILQNVREKNQWRLLRILPINALRLAHHGGQQHRLPIGVPQDVGIVGCSDLALEALGVIVAEEPGEHSVFILDYKEAMTGVQRI